MVKRFTGNGSPDRPPLWWPIHIALFLGVFGLVVHGQRCHRERRVAELCLNSREIFIDGHRARIERDGVYVGTLRVAALPRHRECVYFNFRRLHPR
jgi:hypothetical protein